MAYLPGVPDMGPAPVTPTVGKSTITKGAPKGIPATAHKVGKPGRSQSLGSLVGRHTAGMSAGVTGGSATANSLGHYGKQAPALLGGNLSAGDSNPAASHAGAKIVRGGNMRSHIRTGGLATQAPVGADIE